MPEACFKDLSLKAWSCHMLNYYNLVLRICCFRSFYEWTLAHGFDKKVSTPLPSQMINFFFTKKKKTC